MTFAIDGSHSENHVVLGLLHIDFGLRCACYVFRRKIRIRGLSPQHFIGGSPCGRLPFQLRIVFQLRGQQPNMCRRSRRRRQSGQGCGIQPGHVPATGRLPSLDRIRQLLSGPAIAASQKAIAAAESIRSKRIGFNTSLSLKRTDFGMDQFVEATGDDVRIEISFEGVKQ